jgi:flagellar protein FliS
MQAHQHYQRVNISTADPLRIVIMLYEGAIKNLNQALRLLDANVAEAGARIGRALEIIHYLHNALDHEKGGDIAANLQRLYDYLRDILNEANIRHDHAKIREAIALLQTLLEGWRGILSGQTTEQDADLSSGGLSLVG